MLSSKGMGLVNEVFTQEDLDKLKGNIGVGHVRYSTAGASTRENAQPLVLNYIKGTLALAHNGNLVNAPELRRELAHDGAKCHEDAGRFLFPDCHESEKTDRCP